MCVNKHLALNATIGAAMGSGYEESAAVPAAEVWSDILERLAFQAEDDANARKAATVAKKIIGSDYVLESSTINAAASDLAGQTALIMLKNPFKGLTGKAKLAMQKKYMRNLRKKIDRLTDRYESQVNKAFTASRLKNEDKKKVRDQWQNDIKSYRDAIAALFENFESSLATSASQ